MLKQRLTIFPVCLDLIKIAPPSFKTVILQGALCGVGEEIQSQNCYIRNSNDVLIQNQKYVFFSISE